MSHVKRPTSKRRAASCNDHFKVVMTACKRYAAVPSSDGSMSPLVRIHDTSRGTSSRAAERRHLSNHVRMFVRHVLSLCGRTSTCVSESSTDGGRVSPAVVLFSTLSCLCPNTRRFWVVGVFQEFCPCLHATRRVVGAVGCVLSTSTSPLLPLLSHAPTTSAPVRRARTRRGLRDVLCLSLRCPLVSMVVGATSLTSTGIRIGGPSTSARTVAAALTTFRCRVGGF